MSLSFLALATKTSWPHSSSTLLAQGEWVPASIAMRMGCSETKRRLRASQQVALILTRAHHACTIGRVDFSAEPSVCFMRYGSITLKSAVRGGAQPTFLHNLATVLID